MIVTLACSLLLSLPRDDAKPVEGQVLTFSGRKVGGVEVYFGPDFTQQSDGVVPIFGKTTTDAEGRFKLDAPDLAVFKGVVAAGTIWAYKPGSGIGAADWRPAIRQPITVRLAEDSKHPVLIADGAGKPIAGVAVAPFRARGVGDPIKAGRVPDALIERLAARTDAEGRAEIRGLGSTNPLSFAQVSSPQIGIQLIGLRKGGDGTTWEGVIDRVGALSGKVARRGGGSPSKLELGLEVSLEPISRSIPVNPPGGPIRVAEDGTFRTPPCLLAGTCYRVTFRGDGVNPATTAWVKGAGADKTVECPGVTLAELRSVAGRVVDRQGKPIIGAELIQCGDGPEKTTTRSDGDGRFRLGGYDEGTALIVARAPGFRYGGRVVVEGDNPIVLTRLTERPERAMPATAPPIPREAMRETALKLLAPGLQNPKAAEATRTEALRRLMYVDPVEAFNFAEKQKKIEDPNIVRLLAPGLFRTDPERADLLLKGLKDQRERAVAILAICDNLPPGPSAGRQQVLDRLVTMAIVSGDAPLSVWMRGEIAERLVEAGRTEEARSIFANGLKEAVPLGKADPQRVRFALSLSRLEPETALALVHEVPDKRQRSAALVNLAARVAESRPESFDRVNKALAVDATDYPVFTVISRLARVDPDQARKVVASEHYPDLRPLDRMALAVGLPDSAKEEAEDLVHQAISESEATTGDQHAYLMVHQTIDLVEAINPELVPEFVWVAASRRDRFLVGRPGETPDTRDAQLAATLARYNREVAAALFAPVLESMGSKTLEEMDTMRDDFSLATAQLFPEKVATVIESLPDASSGPNRPTLRDRAVAQVAMFFGRWCQGIRPPLHPDTWTIYEQTKRRDPIRS